MKISKKCQYAIKAVFELAWRNSGKAIKTNHIADSQNMSTRFTEIILNELKHGGFVTSKRGFDGGYSLAKDAQLITVKEVIELIEGPVSIAPASENPKSQSPGNLAIQQLFNDVNSSIKNVYNNKTFADLVKIERKSRDSSAPNYSI